MLVHGRPLPVPTWAAPSEKSALVSLPNSVFNSGGQQQLISTWGGRGAFNHNWNPYWSTSVYGAFAKVNYGGSAAGIFCASFVASNAGVTSCNPNYSVSQVGTVTRWSPVKNLTFSAEYVYSHLAQNNTGVITANGPYGTRLLRARQPGHPSGPVPRPAQLVILIV